MRNGIAYRLPPLVHLTDATGSGLLATPTKTANQLSPSMMKWPGCAAWWTVNQSQWPTPRAEHDSGRHRGRPDTLHSAVKMYPTPTAQDANNNGGASQYERNALPLNALIGGALNPVFVEWLMGYPRDYTEV